MVSIIDKIKDSDLLNSIRNLANVNKDSGGVKNAGVNATVEGKETVVQDSRDKPTVQIYTPDPAIRAAKDRLLAADTLTRQQNKTKEIAEALENKQGQRKKTQEDSASQPTATQEKPLTSKVTIDHPTSTSETEQGATSEQRDDLTANTLEGDDAESAGTGQKLKTDTGKRTKRIKKITEKNAEEKTDKPNNNRSKRKSQVEQIPAAQVQSSARTSSTEIANAEPDNGEPTYYGKNDKIRQQIDWAVALNKYDISKSARDLLNDLKCESIYDVVHYLPDIAELASKEDYESVLKFVQAYIDDHPDKADDIARMYDPPLNQNEGREVEYRDEDKGDQALVQEELQQGVPVDNTPTKVEVISAEDVPLKTEQDTVFVNEGIPYDDGAFLGDEPVEGYNPSIGTPVSRINNTSEIPRGTHKPLTGQSLDQVFKSKICSLDTKIEDLFEMMLDNITDPEEKLRVKAYVDESIKHLHSLKIMTFKDLIVSDQEIWLPNTLINDHFAKFWRSLADDDRVTEFAFVASATDYLAQVFQERKKLKHTRKSIANAMNLYDKLYLNRNYQATNAYKKDWKSVAKWFESNSLEDDDIANIFEAFSLPQELWDKYMRLQKEMREGKSNEEYQEFLEDIKRYVIGQAKAKNSKSKLMQELNDNSEETMSFLGQERYEEFNHHADEDVATRNRRKAIKLMQKLFLNPYIFIKGAKPVFKYGAVRYEVSESVAEKVSAVSKMYGWNDSWTMLLVLLCGGIGVDRKGQIVNMDMDSFELTEGQVIGICDRIMKSQILEGHPFHYMRHMKKVTIGGTVCYPMGFLPMFLATKMVKSKGVLYAGSTDDLVVNKKVLRLQRKVKKDWVENTLPAILSKTKKENQSQWLALSNMMRALASFDDVELSDNPEWGISVLKTQSITDIELEKFFSAEGEKDGQVSHDEVLKVREELTNYYCSRLYNRFHVENPNPGTNQVKYIEKASKFTKTCAAVAAMMRFCGVVLNAFVYTPGIVEKVNGDITSSFANSMYRKVMHVPDDYRMSEMLKNAAKSNEASVMQGYLNELYGIAGAEAVKAFVFNGEYQKNAQGLGEFLDAYVGERNKAGRGLEKLNELARKVKEGRIGPLQRSDAKRFLDMWLTNNSINAARKTGLMNADDIENMFKKGNSVSEVMCYALTTPEGWEAFIATPNMNMGRRSPQTAATRRLVRRNGVTDLASTTYLATFPEYAIAMMELYFPMSNTLSYLVAHAAKYGVPKALQGTKLAKMIEDMGPNVALYQMGMMNLDSREELPGQAKFDSIAFWNGFKKNLIYDVCKIGNIVLIAAFWTVFSDLMDDDDEDPLAEVPVDEDGNPIEDTSADITAYVVPKDEKYNWKAYIKNNLPVWWLNDLTAWGLPLGTAIHAFQKTNNPNIGLNVMADGFGDMGDGLALFDIMRMINHPQDEFNIVNKVVGHPDDVKPLSWDSMMKRFLMFTADSLTGKLTPTVVKDFMIPNNVSDNMLVGDQARDHSPFLIWNNAYDDPVENNYTTSASEEEQALRCYTYRNPTLGFLCNVFLNNQIHYDADTEKTGFMKNQMPVATMPDNAALHWQNEFGWTNEDLPSDAEEQKEFLDNKAVLLYETLQQFETPEEAQRCGVMVPVEAKKNLKHHLLAENAMLMDLASAEASYGLSDEEVSEMYDARQENLDFIDLWLDSDVIPNTSKQYEKLYSETQELYFMPDGTPTNKLMYTLNRDVIKRVQPLGNPKTSILPITSVRDDDTTGYNQEVLTSWYSPTYTDPKKVYELYHNAGPLKFGRNKDKYINELTFGGTGILEEASSSETGSLFENMIEDLQIPILGQGESTKKNGGLVTGTRGYVPVKNQLPEEEMTEETVAKELGIDIEKAKQQIHDAHHNGGGGYYNSNWFGGGRSWKGFGSGRRYYGGGGGGGNYNPKIYATVGHTGGTKSARGMQTRAPYKAASTYLRPDFKTKGSREAYRRSDF